MIDIDVQRTLFDPVERAILSDYFGNARTADIRDIDIHAASDDRDTSTGARRIRVRLNQSGKTCEHTVGNAVARLALNAIREQLPRWYAGYEDGTHVLGRDPEPGLLRDVQLKPVHVFSINWADSGPGYSWPVALGWFPGKTPIVKGSRGVLVGFWRSISEYQPKWQDFLEGGVVDNAMADRWVRGVLRNAEEW